MPEQTVQPMELKCRANRYGACPVVQQMNKHLADQTRKSKKPEAKTTIGNDTSKMRNIDQD